MGQNLGRRQRKAKRYMGLFLNFRSKCQGNLPADSMAVFESAKRSGREIQWSGKRRAVLTHQLHRHRRGLAAADAEAGDTALEPVSLKRRDQGSQNACAR